MEETIYDVTVVGAGATGLMAAWELVQTGKKVAVIEARDRIGGRIHTATNSNFSMPVELGAEFVHGNLELTQLLLKKANIDTVKSSGDIWQKKADQLQKQEDFIEDYDDLEKKFKDLKEDIPVGRFIKHHLQEEKYEELRFTLKNYVEGYYAADIDKASTIALCEELTTSDDEQYRVEGGYQKLIEFICKQAEQKGCLFYLSTPVQHISWKENYVEVTTNQQSFYSRKILITASLGVLQNEQITFYPAIKEKITAAQQLGFGPVIKLILQFDHAFWKDSALTSGKNLSKLSFLFSEEIVPTWWTQHPKEASMITGWLGGPHAQALKDLSEKEILEKGLESLHAIFNVDLPYLEKSIKGWHVANWTTDIYSFGGYAYEVVNGANFRKIMKQPLLNTLFFAGEAFCDGPQIGTVEAALVSGRETAHQIIASFDNKL